MSTPDRKAMLDRDRRRFSIRGQCVLLSLARSGVYRPQRPANDDGRAWQRGLGGEIEEFVDESHFACDPGFDQDAMAAPDHAHDLEALDRGVSGLHRLEAPGGTDQPFERTMIGLDPVVEVLRRPVPDRVFQLALPFQPAQCLRIGTKLVGGDRVMVVRAFGPMSSAQRVEITKYMKPLLPGRSSIGQRGYGSWQLAERLPYCVATKVAYCRSPSALMVGYWLPALWRTERYNYGRWRLVGLLPSAAPTLPSLPSPSALMVGHWQRALRTRQRGSFRHRCWDKTVPAKRCSCSN